MRTGYAVVLTQGVSLMEYLMKCAIAEGAELMQAAPPADLPPPEQSPVAAAVKDAIVALEAAAALTEAEAEAGAEAAYQAAVSQLETTRQARAALRRTYERALFQLRCLELPAFLEQFKADRIAEIEQSIARDCCDKRDRLPVRMTANQWRVQRINDAQHLLEHLQASALRYLWVETVMNHLGAKNTETA